MKSQDLFRFIIVFAALSIAFLAFGVQPVSALPPAPAPVNPADGSSIVTPTFTWLASTGAAKYELEVGPQSDPNTVYWSDQTVNLTLTSNDALKFTNIPLYWRVRAYDSANLPGAWSSKVNFTKHIPAPMLVSPPNAGSIVTPELEWQAVQGAAYYQVELSTSSTFIAVDDTYLTYNTHLIPASTITHGTHYWRVSGMDADGHMGTPSDGWSFIKDIPAPILVSPANGNPNIHIPTLEWQTAEGAAYYKVELSTSPTFVPVDNTYVTYNTRITPEGTFAHGTHYWRVSGVDADGHAGTPSAVWSFTKNTVAPVLVSPGVNANVSVPTMEWQAVDGAAYYKVELSASVTFVPVAATYITYNLRVTPVATLALGMYYWRVSGVDAGGHVGNNNLRNFTLIAPPAATDVTPQLQAPADMVTINTDPSFNWSRVIGAHDYHLIVSKYSDFHAPYESIFTHFDSYTPYKAGSHNAFLNGAYYWKVEARNGSGAVIAKSVAHSFTKLEVLPLTGPADGVIGLVVDPSFGWSQIVGAARYRLIVSIYADFHAIYDSVYPDYNSYTPYSAGSKKAYPNDTYYWKVEARNSENAVITTSEGRSLTKQVHLPLSGPADGVSGLVVDPTFQWNQIVGAQRYHLIVSVYSDFHEIFDSVYPDYTRYKPYNIGTYNAYPNDTYYWKVEARNSDNEVITTSAARIFTKQAPLPLIAPANGDSGLKVDPTFHWNQIVGANRYQLIVSKFADFHAVYDSVYCDYTLYTPYAAGSYSAYPNGIYYWKVEALNSDNVVITTSSNWSFTIVVIYQQYIPLTRKSSP